MRTICRKHLVFLLIICSGCDERIPEKNTSEVVNYFDDEVSMSERYHVVDNTLKDGLYLNYFKCGIVSYIKNYKNGILFGKQLYYYDDGILNSIQNRTSVGIEGMSIEYYRSGMLKTVGRYKNNRKVMSHYEYSPNGDISSYSFYDLQGELRYTAQYDSVGLVVSEAGELESYYYYSPDPNQKPILDIGDSLVVNMITPLPPHLRVNIVKYRSNDKEERKDPLNIPLSRFDTSRFVIKFDKTGLHYWLIVRQVENLVRLTKGEEYELGRIEVR